MATPRRFALVACEILFREACACAARSPNVVDPVFLPKALHDVGKPGMSARLQEAIDRIDAARYDAILLGYGLCSNGVEGLRSRATLVLPRAHDCITLLLGSKERYADVFGKNPGTYFKSPGWLERGEDAAAAGAGTIPARLGMGRSFEELKARFGEENAKYLMETMTGWEKAYSKLAYIDTGVGDAPAYKELTRREAERRGWTYEELPGSLALLQRLVDEEWDAPDFLVVPPGRTLKPTYGDDVVGLA
jgi:hypothetical protein